MAEQSEHPGTVAAGGFVRTVPHVRLNPGMYVGNVATYGLHHTLFRLVAGSLAEAAAGFGREVRITTHVDGSVEVSDDGRGLPTAGPNDPTLEAALTTFIIPRPATTGRDWLDYMTANALSEWLEVESRHDGRLDRQEFRRGVPDGPPWSVGPAAGNGLSVAYRPDPDLFEDTHFSGDDIRDRLRQYAFLHSGVRLVWADRATGRQEVFEYADGIRSFVAWLDVGRHPLHPDVVVARGEADGVRYEVGLQWCAADDPAGGAFVNGERTRGFAGTPVAGLRAAVTRSLNEFARDRLPGTPPLRGGQAGDGLTAVVSVWLADPLFLGATKYQLDNPEARGVVEAGVGRVLREYLSANPDAAERVFRAAAAPPGGRSPPTAAEWPSCTDAWRMLRLVDPTGGRRKATLLACAFCRLLAGRNGADRKLIETIEDYADGQRTGEEVRRARGTSHGMRRVVGAVLGVEFSPFVVARLASALSTGNAAATPNMAELVREVFGNPFRPATLDPSWRTEAVVALARGMYESRDYGPMPVLADALQDAGCDHPDVLAHCRGEGEHMRGCWVVDLVLGKE